MTATPLNESNASPAELNSPPTFMCPLLGSIRGLPFDNAPKGTASFASSNAEWEMCRSIPRPRTCVSLSTRLPESVDRPFRRRSNATDEGMTPWGGKGAPSTSSGTTGISRLRADSISSRTGLVNWQTSPRFANPARSIPRGHQT